MFLPQQPDATNTLLLKLHQAVGSHSNTNLTASPLLWRQKITVHWYSLLKTRKLWCCYEGKWGDSYKRTKIGYFTCHKDMMVTVYFNILANFADCVLNYLQDFQLIHTSSAFDVLGWMQKQAVTHQVIISNRWEYRKAWIPAYATCISACSPCLPSQL